VELLPIAQGFTGFPTHTGNLVNSGQVSTITVQPLVFNSYHWRARTTTATNTSSGWVSFGTNADGQTDFQLFVAPDATAPGGESKDKCGLTGLEILALAGLLALRRRRRA
jgi:hypothetical protein